MTVHVGTTHRGPSLVDVIFPTGLGTTPYLDLDTPPTFDGEIGDFGLTVKAPAGPITKTSVIPVPKRFVGYVSDEVGEHWFEKIILWPTELELGAIGSDLVETVEMLNNYRHQTNNWLSTVDHDLNGEIEIVSHEPPLPFAPLQSIILEMNIPLAGTPTIDGELEFVWDVGSAFLPIYGIRVILLPYRSDDAEGGITETLEFQTDVISKVSGAEQRISLRANPRQIIEMRLVLEDDERKRLDALLYDSHNRVFGVSKEWEKRAPTSDIVSGGYTIEVDTRFADFRVGELAAIITENGDDEVYRIESLTDSQITLTSQIATDRVATEVAIAPAILCYTQDAIDQSQYPVEVEVTAFRFTTIMDYDRSGSGDFEVWNDKYIMDWPNMVTGLVKPKGWQTRLDVFDSGEKYSVYSPWLKSKPITEIKLLAQTPTEVWNIRHLFYSLRGRQKSFYLPSRREEMAMAANALNHATTIDIDHMDFVKRYGASPKAPRNAIRITRTDGTTSNHTINTASVISGSVERLSLADEITPALDADDVARIEFLSLMRLREDTVRIQHARPGLATYEAFAIGVLS